MPSMEQIKDFIVFIPCRSKLDLTDEYHDISSHPDSVGDSTFTCHMGKFDSLVILQGDCNAPATKMRAMNYLFREVKDLRIYLYNVLIANNTYAEHLTTSRQVLQMAKQNELWFNRHKCQFMPNKRAILRDYLTERGLEAYPDKVNTIEQFPKPDNSRQQQRFLGIVNYITQVCLELATAAVPLSEVQGSIKQWKWSHLHLHSFQTCKALIMSNKVVKPIDSNPGQRICLIRNSSNIELSGWIGQMQDDDMIRPGRFHSKKFNNAQMNYGITKKELLAIVDSVRNFRGVLEWHAVTILTDHQPLLAFISSLQTNPMIIRWQESLNQLDITMEHIDGEKNVIADALSRTHKECEEVAFV